MKIMSRKAASYLAQSGPFYMWISEAITAACTANKLSTYFMRETKEHWFQPQTECADMVARESHFFLWTCINSKCWTAPSQKKRLSQDDHYFDSLEKPLQFLTKMKMLEIILKSAKILKNMVFNLCSMHDKMAFGNSKRDSTCLTKPNSCFRKNCLPHRLSYSYFIIFWLTF